MKIPPHPLLSFKDMHKNCSFKQIKKGGVLLFWNVQHLSRYVNFLEMVSAQKQKSPAFPPCDKGPLKVWAIKDRTAYCSFLAWVFLPYDQEYFIA